MKKLFFQLLPLATIFIGFNCFAIRQACGIYVGTGSGTRAVTGCGFQPEVVLIKPSTSASAFIATSTMASGKTKVLDPADVLKSNYINSLNADGFTAGTSANAAGVTYYYTAFDDDSDLDVGTYTGSTSSQTVTLGYRPAMLWVLGEAGDWNDYGNISQDGWDNAPDAFNNGSILDASSASVGSYLANGFNVPASGSSGVDDGAVYHYVAFKPAASVYTGTYTGTGAAQSVSFGVQPDFVIVKNTSNPNDNVWFKTYAMPSTTSYKFVDGASTIAIDGFTSNAFTVGVQGEVNGSGNTLQYYALGSATGTLPVKITYFTAVKNDNKILIEWQTSSEINSHYFILERSVDGIHYESIGYIDAAGSSNHLLSYSFSDNDPMRDNNYYRLKQVDSDGSYEYFKTAVVNFSNGDAQVISVYPNPAINNTLIHFDSNKIKEINLSDATGKFLLRLNVEGQNSYNLNTSNLTEGIYYLNSTDFFTKLIVIK